MNRARSASVKRRNQADSSVEGDTSVTESKCNANSNVKKTKKAPKRPKLSEEKQSGTIPSHFNRLTTTNMAANSAIEQDSDTDSLVDMCGNDKDNASGDCSNKDLMRMLMNMNDGLNKKLDALSGTVEQLKGEVFDLHQENNKLATELQKCEKQQEDTHRQVEEALYVGKLAYERANENEQYSRRSNLKLLFVDESKENPESAEESEKKVLTVLHEQLKLTHITPDLIEAAHRVGKRQAGRNRPIIVKFLSRKTKQEVVRNRRLLKGAKPKVVIVEDLTKPNYTLYRQAADRPGIQSAWTSDGKIFAKDDDDRIHLITKLSDLERVRVASPKSTNPSTSTPSTRSSQH